MKKALLAGVAMAVAFTATAAQADIVIAAAGPMTGQYATFGAQMRAGAQLAVDDINAAGGINGEKVVLEIGDDACDPKQAVAVANQFVGKEVVFVAGHFCSGSSIPASNVYAEEGILMITPASTNPKVTDERPGDNILRFAGRDDAQGAVAGAYIVSNFAGKNVAILHDKTAYGKGLADETKKSMEALGHKAALYEAFTAGEKDYTALVSKLKGEGIDVAYLGGYHTEAGLIVRQMRDQGMNTILMSGDALATDEFWQISGEAGAGTLMTFPPDPRDTPSAAGIVKSFRDNGVEPEGYTVYTYATVMVWADAAKAAASTDVDAVVAVLNSTTFNTAFGDVSFNDIGDATLDGYIVYQWKAGAYKPLN
ncbi:MAG: branched-chain amino acid ABC transporter substrate-binding protein [Cohaesibacteraceae bacterium]|nr:branched-chain amino acid ABC transporter substrate-binding protein [Cohaesibacteraceae bacterium]